MARSTRKILSIALLAAGAAAAVTAAGGEASGRVAPGKQAPEFTLPSAVGGEHRLADARGEKDLVLVFFRGAW